MNTYLAAIRVVGEWSDIVRNGMADSVYKLLKDVGFCVRKLEYEDFGDASYTIVYVLSESHCILHTYKEIGVIYVDLFSCKSLSYNEVDKLFESMASALGGVVVYCNQYIR